MEFPPLGTVLGQLTSAMMRMRSVTEGLQAVRVHLSTARELAVEQHRPTNQIVALQHDLDALEQLVFQEVEEFIQRLAEVEARSRG